MIKLTEKQARVVLWVAKGHTLQEAAMALGIKRSTVEDHLRKVYKNLGVNNRSELALEAQRLGLFGSHIGEKK